MPAGTTMNKDDNPAQAPSTGAQSLSGASRMNAFVDALTRYVIDPASFEALTAEIDHLEKNWQAEDAAELLAQLSRAETLSWQIKQEGGEIAGNGFAFVLLDDKDRVVAHSDNLLQLGEYLKVTRGNRLKFSTEDSRASYDAAKDRLRNSPRGHILVELNSPHSARHRFGYLVAQAEFPEALKLLGNGATRGMLIAQEHWDDKLHGVVQASFGLTAAETDIMLKIASGMTLKQAAAELDISINTVRNHLQSIYAKSGINRQGELVLVVTQLSIILAATGDAPGEPAASNRQRPDASDAHHFIILKDGRRLAYRTYGDPMGWPVLYLHESIGSSRLLPRTDSAARSLGLYIIAPERPGCGHSDPNPEFDFESVIADLLHLLNHLRITRCQLLGFLSGAAYALMLANAYPERISRLMLVAGRPPAPMTGRFGFLMTLRDRMMGQPWLLSTFFNILRNRASEETNRKLIRSVYGAVNHDRELLKKQPELSAHMVSYTLESLSVSAAGVINELQCFNRATEVTLNSLRAPIITWHGSADALAAPEDLQQFLGDRVSESRVFADAGSLILLEHWPDVLATLSAGADDL